MTRYVITRAGLGWIVESASDEGRRRMNLPTEDLMLTFIRGVTADEERCTIELTVGRDSKVDAETVSRKAA